MKYLLLLAAFLSLPLYPSAQSTHPRTTHKKVVHHAGAKVKAKTKAKAKASTGPKVYYCNSGNTVKYHATPGCRGLARCGRGAHLPGVGPTTDGPVQVVLLGYLAAPVGGGAPGGVGCLGSRVDG
ncbi:hypothetical protein [Hymenobacter ruricola]|uniref:DUF3761 domain-containing protein n=1 Tax=Hymenobacter ruricola TaxID=2791023 RepID=A0ABS0I7V3_9BACT|nr:hypothetical protein [Hymenobacter ruricola]MBF9223010.1 hypothetical protein [Hymenobacter ruricola]